MYLFHTRFCGLDQYITIRYSLTIYNNLNNRDNLASDIRNIILNGSQKQIMKTNIGICYLVATPIGNFRDITLRAIDILSSADIIVCEEYRRGTTLLKKIGVDAKEILELNEHNEQANAMDIVTRILKNQNVAVISDHGTPGFEDPGHYLIELCVEMGIRIVPIPGPSSLMAALSISNRKMDRFVYGGFLPRDKSQRKNQLLRLKASNLPIIIIGHPLSAIRYPGSCR